jgi:flagellar FliJ protein
MSRFNFRLQKVLELKEQSEQRAASELARAQDRVDEARAAHETLAAIRAAGAAQLAAAHGESATVGQLQNIGFVLQQLDEHVTQASEVSDSAQSGLRDAQAMLTAAHQERRVLDRLRDRKKDEWQHAETQSDLQHMDSLALTRFAKQNPQHTDDA